MELDILKHFIRFDVEVLVGGVWIEGTLQPIAKGVIVLLPFLEHQPFYGPASCTADSIQAIRQVKRNNTLVPNVVPVVETPVPIKSGFESVPPNFRFSVKKDDQR